MSSWMSRVSHIRWYTDKAIITLRILQTSFSRPIAKEIILLLVNFQIRLTDVLLDLVVNFQIILRLGTLVLFLG